MRHLANQRAGQARGLAEHQRLVDQLLERRAPGQAAQPLDQLHLAEHQRTAVHHRQDALDHLGPDRQRTQPQRGADGERARPAGGRAAGRLRTHGRS